MLLSDYIPQSKLVTKVTPIEAPRFPVIDGHNHLNSVFGGGWDQRPVQELLDNLNACGVSELVDLDGGWGEEVLDFHLDKFKAAAPERFHIFGGVDWWNWEEQGNHFGEWAAKRLAGQKARGAEGLKIWKGLGLSIHDPQGALVRVDDPRLDPIWQAAGELKLPVTIHVGDPVAFFDPLDGTNERWEELQGHTDWQFPSPPFPPFTQIMDELARVVLRHPQTTFIGAHVGCYAENLAWVSDLLERAPNFYVDISARISELGRQPYRARRFFMRFSERILFGTDFPGDPDWYRIHYRFLETDDEYFNYVNYEPPSQGRWYIYGLHLPDDVLEKVYYGNAKRLLQS